MPRAAPAASPSRRAFGRELLEVPEARREGSEAQTLADKDGYPSPPGSAIGEVIDPEETQAVDAPVLDSFVNMNEDGEEAEGSSLEDEATLVDASDEQPNLSKLKTENTGIIPPIHDEES